MLYYLHEILNINILLYITVRAGVGFILGFLLTLWAMPKFIAWAKSKSANQPIYELAPESHKVKSDTPTMGGVIFISATLFTSLLTVDLSNHYVQGGLAILLLVMLIGVKDDIAKIGSGKNSAGLSPKAKMGLQIVSAGIVATFIYFIGFDTTFHIPFYKNPVFDMGLFAIIFWIFVMVASSNAVNLTDGLDGLATMPSFLSLLTLSIIVYVVGHAGFSAYLFMPKVIGVGEVSIIALSLAGSLLGFLWYNANPAEVFMGDSGSLSIGAFIGYVAILGKSEVLLILIGLIFVIETISVILQVYSFKTRGKRVFLMAPIHHHYELKGWKENKIIVRFWLISILANLLAIITLKLR